MRKYLILIAALFVLGCEKNQALELAENNKVDSALSLNQQAKLEPVKTVGKGAMCGGIAGLMCGEGLECKISVQYADASGTCIESVTQKDLICAKERKPVCAIKNGTKNGYLNECEAIRHGADIVSTGFCKIDETVAGNCEAKFTTIGNCEKAISAFVFNVEKNVCTKKWASGCEGEIPFSSLEDCQTTCVK